VDDVAEQVMAEFAKPGELPYFIYERLMRFGSRTVAPLKAVLETTGDDNLRVLAAAGLLRFGAGTGIPVLIDAIRAGGADMHISLRALSHCGVQDAVPVILEALRERDVADVQAIESLVSGLWELGHELPEDLRARLGSVEPGYLRDSLVETKEQRSIRRPDAHGMQ
jgi:hypothetical protein